LITRRGACATSPPLSLPPSLPADVPQTIALPAVRDWARSVRERALRLVPSEATLGSLAALQGTVLAPGDLGALSTPGGRAFVNALWAADGLAYDDEADRVDFVRLAFVVSVFPAGFTLYLAKDPHGESIPVGYTGFYPITRDNFEYLARGPSDFVHRGQAVPMPAAGLHLFLYVFNCSMAPPLRKTAATRRMLRTLADQLRAQPRAGLCAITVSEAGARVAARLGMARLASLTVAGSPHREWVFGIAT